jgi:4-amino-4-deoxy-L-arabinose transferase-like glycosyltransferase
VLAATLAAACLRLFHLGHQSLWIDEVFSWYSAGVGTPLAALDPLDNVHGALHGLLLHGLAGVLGDAEWVLRLPSAIAGVLTVPAMAWLGALWLGPRVAAPAAWLAAGSPFLVWYSQEARNYALLILFTVLAGGALLSMRDRLRPGPLAGYVAASAAGLLSNPGFAFLAPLHLRWGLGAPGRRARRAALAAAVALLLGLLLLPWAPSAVATWDWARLAPGRAAPAGEEALRGTTTFHALALPYAAWVFSAGYGLGPPLREMRRLGPGEALRRHAPVVAAGAGLFGVLGALGLAAMARRRRLFDFALWVGVPVVVVSYFALQNFKVFHPRYVAMAAPALLLVYAVALADSSRGVRRALAAGLVLAWGLALWNHYFDPARAKDDYRGAARLVAERGARGETVVAVRAIDPLIYYYRGSLPLNALWLGHVRDPARLDRELDRLLDGARGAWIVLSREEDLDPAGIFARRMAERFPDGELHAFAGVRVWHVTLGPPGTPAVR